MKNMVNVQDVANYFIALAQDAGEQLTHMKLQKLLYYSQAWYLGNFGHPLFDCEFQAWTYGPVCPEIYQEYKDCGRDNILFSKDCNVKDGCLPIAEAALNKGTVDFLKSIADDYMKFSAYELSEMTHQDPFWKEKVWYGGSISNKEMMDYYKELILSDEEFSEIKGQKQLIQEGKGVKWTPGMFS